MTAVKDLPSKVILDSVYDETDDRKQSHQLLRSHQAWRGQRKVVVGDHVMMNSLPKFTTSSEV